MVRKFAIKKFKEKIKNEVFRCLLRERRCMVHPRKRQAAKDGA
jgi:hypothetical protein